MSLPIAAACRVIATGAVSGAMLFAGTAIAAADGPLDCTAADLARAASGVSNATADYLFTHPDVNGFFTGLKGLDEEAVRASTEDYLNANPQVRTDLQNIRQPLVDFRTRCQ